VTDVQIFASCKEWTVVGQPVTKSAFFFKTSKTPYRNFTPDSVESTEKNLERHPRKRFQAKVYWGIPPKGVILGFGFFTFSQRCTGNTKSAKKRSAKVSNSEFPVFKFSGNFHNL
jgi:hypothetical protein